MFLILISLECLRQRKALGIRVHQFLDHTTETSSWKPALVGACLSHRHLQMLSQGRSQGAEFPGTHSLLGTLCSLCFHQWSLKETEQKKMNKRLLEWLNHITGKQSSNTSSTKIRGILTEVSMQIAGISCHHWAPWIQTLFKELVPQMVGYEGEIPARPVLRRVGI